MLIQRTIAPCALGTEVPHVWQMKLGHSSSPCGVGWAHPWIQNSGVLYPLLTVYESVKEICKRFYESGGSVTLREVMEYTHQNSDKYYQPFQAESSLSLGVLLCQNWTLKCKEKTSCL